MTKERSHFVQIGATRDGMDPYLNAARERDMRAVLVETPDYVRWRKALGRREFDITLEVEKPTDPSALVAAINELPEIPALILPGFERYVAPAYAAAHALAVRPSGMGEDFVPPYKAAQRAALNGVDGVHQPRFRRLSSLTEMAVAARELSYPMVVKPNDGGGSLGVLLIGDADGLRVACEALTGLNNFDGGAFDGWMVEEYVEGDEFSVQGVVREGHVTILTVCEKIIATEPLRDGTAVWGFRETGHVAGPGALADIDMVQFTRTCLAAVGYRHGPFHVDLMRKADQMHLLEMGFRLSGFRVADLVTRVSGIDWGDEAFRALLDEPQGRIDDTVRYVGHLSARRPVELHNAAALAASGLRVEIQRIEPPALPDEWRMGVPASLSSDLMRHAGALGRLVVTGPSSGAVRMFLENCREAGND